MTRCGYVAPRQLLFDLQALCLPSREVKFNIGTHYIIRAPFILLFW